MTIKTQNNFKVSAYTRTTGDNQNPVVTDVRQARNFSWFRDGYDNPLWRQQVKLMESATTTMTAERRDLISVPGEMFLHYGNTPSWYNVQRTYGDYFGYKASIMTYDPVDFDFSTADNLAKAKFLSDLKSRTQKFSGGVFLGELKETLRMIRSPAKALFNGFNTYRKACLKNKRLARGNVKEYVESVRQSWLEFQFGVKPLLHDIKDGATAYRELMGDEDELISRESIRGVGKWTQVTSTTTPTDYGNGFLFTQEISRKSWDVVCVYRGDAKSVLSCAPSSAVDKVIDVLGLGQREWLPTAWELIPFSFVVDYFTNIGDILSSITTSRDSLLWVNRTTIATRSEYLTATPDWPKVNSTVSNIWAHGDSGLGYALSTMVRVHRMPILDFNFYPTLVLELPPFDSLKWLNLAALVGGFRSIKPR